MKFHYPNRQFNSTDFIELNDKRTYKTRLLEVTFTTDNVYILHKEIELMVRSYRFERITERKPK